MGDWITIRRRAPVVRSPECVVPYRLRPLDLDMERPFLMATYLPSYWRRGFWAERDRRTGRSLVPVHGEAGRLIPRPVFEVYQHAVMDSILEHAVATAVCDPADDWHLLGYLVSEDLPGGVLLHYIYLKKVYRGAGLGRELVVGLLDGRGALTATHYTDRWRMLAHSLAMSGVQVGYNPYLAR